MATSYDFSPETVGAIQGLKETFGVKTNTGVIRRAIDLAALIAAHVDMSKGTLVIGGDDGVLIRVAIV